MRKLSVLLALLMLLPLVAQELKHYSNSPYKFSFDYPADFELNEDQEQLRKIMDTGQDVIDTSKMSPELRDAMTHVGPQFILGAPSGAVMVCLTTPVNEAQLAVPTLDLARASLKEAIVTIPGSKTLSEPAEVMMGDNLLVRYELELQVKDETTTRQVQYMVRNSELRALYLFAVTSDSSTFGTDVVPFETIIKSLKLDFATSDRGQG